VHILFDEFYGEYLFFLVANISILYTKFLCLFGQAVVAFDQNFKYNDFKTSDYCYKQKANSRKSPTYQVYMKNFKAAYCAQYSGIKKTFENRFKIYSNTNPILTRK